MSTTGRTWVGSCHRTGGSVLNSRKLYLMVVVLLAAMTSAQANAARPLTLNPPPSFVADALCVHSGWHYTSKRPSRSARPEYVLWQHGYWRTWDVPDSIKGGSGEGGWSTVNSYGGGMQFTLGTWNAAARLSSGSVPYVSSNSAIAGQLPRVQILAAYFIVSHRGSWGDWPWTSRACGLR